MAVQDQRIASAQAERRQIDQDQARLRDNIKALKDTAEARELIARYVAKANQQETRIEQLATEENAAQTEKDRLQAELSAVLISFDPGQKGDR
jgi:septal ring factor EnvC (AmiA/AmiB activator)